MRNYDPSSLYGNPSSSTMATMASQSQQHIVMLPFMAQGHLIPFLALANLISQRHPSYKITLVNTPINIQHLQSLLPPNSTIHLQSLPFTTTDHGLPPNSESTGSLPNSLLINLMLATDTLEPHFDRLIADMTDPAGGRGHHPTCIISDVFCSWAVNVAKRHHIFHAAFSTCGAYGTAAYMSLWQNLPHLETTSQQFTLPSFPKSTTFRRSQLSHFLRSATGSDPATVFFRRHISLALDSCAMLCNTTEAVEPAGVGFLREFTGLKVWTIGPALMSRRREMEIELDDCVEWLDSQAPASVLYVSFGSQNTITRSQMMALAEGLEACGRPFIWVVRPPIGFDLDASFRQEWLPEEFEVRMRCSKQGLLVCKWAPQLEILSHKSTGAFLSHCGWNSVLESLSCGVPMIGWPLAAEQFYNSKMLVEELGAGMEIGRGLGSEIASGEVARVVELVMSDEGRGKEMKEKTVRCATMMRDAMREGDANGSSIEAIDDFIRAISIGSRPV